MYDEFSNKKLVDATLNYEDKNFPINEYGKHMMENSRNSVSIDCLLVCHSYLNQLHENLGYAVDDELLLLKDTIEQRISEYNQNQNIDATKIVSLSRIMINNLIVKHNIISYEDFTCEYTKELAKELHLLDER